MQVSAIQIEQTGGPEVLRLARIELGAPGPGQVRLRQRTCGVNFLDCYHRSGLYPVPLPAVLGTEAAGEVEAVGPGVTHLAVGDRVAYASTTPGGYAGGRVLDAATIVRLPDDVDDATAAAILLKGLTVQYLLRRTHHQLAPGDWLLWHAAAGGVGLIACQWARALGYRVIATAGSPEKCELARAHGAEVAIDYRREDVPARVRALTDGRGVPAVFDSVGKDTWAMSLASLRPLGLLVSFGNASGVVPPVSLRDLASHGSLYVTRPTLTAHLTDATAAAEMSGELFAAVRSGQIVVAPPRRYPLADAARAHRDLESRTTTGSLVLDV